jgi:hypothetical protein
VCGGMGGCGVWWVWGCGECGGVGYVVVWVGVGVYWFCGVGGVGVWGGGGPLAFEHSKVCTLCDFGHLQFCNFRVYLATGPIEGR